MTKHDHKKRLQNFTKRISNKKHISRGAHAPYNGAIYTHPKSLRFPKSLLNDKHKKVGQLLSEGLEGALANLLAA